MHPTHGNSRQSKPSNTIPESTLHAVDDNHAAVRPGSALLTLTNHQINIKRSTP